MAAKGVSKERWQKSGGSSEAAQAVLQKLDEMQKEEREKFGDGTNYCEEQMKIEHSEIDTLRMFVSELIEQRKPDLSKKAWTKECVRLRKKYKIAPSKAQMRTVYDELIGANHAKEQRESVSQSKKERNFNLESYLTRKAVRALSGVLVITLFTSPYPEYTVEVTDDDEDEDDDDDCSDNGHTNNEEGCSSREIESILGDSAETDPKRRKRKTKLKKITQSFSCKHDCYYCPNEPGMPRSYLSEEPGVRRGHRNDWDCVRQFYSRASTLSDIGHRCIDKLEILVLGGTWTEYPRRYQEEFVRDIYFSANTFVDYRNAILSKYRREQKNDECNECNDQESESSSLLLPPPEYYAVPDASQVIELTREKRSLMEEQRINSGLDDNGNPLSKDEQSRVVRIIGLTLETRPDTINLDELRRMRDYGCTRIQIGIQHSDDRMLKLINRGCLNKDAVLATRLCKNVGFKIDYHLMPDLPNSNLIKDAIMFDYVTESNELQCDQMKIYPCQTVPFTRIEQWFSEGRYLQYTQQELLFLLYWFKSEMCSPWIRLNRVIRDIPGVYIIAGNPITNLRQAIHTRLRMESRYCSCIRCREIKGDLLDNERLVLRKFMASKGTELFLSFESPDHSEKDGNNNDSDDEGGGYSERSITDENSRNDRERGSTVVFMSKKQKKRYLRKQARKKAKRMQKRGVITAVKNNDDDNDDEGSEMDEDDDDGCVTWFDKQKNPGRIHGFLRLRFPHINDSLSLKGCVSDERLEHSTLNQTRRQLIESFAQRRKVKELLDRVEKQQKWERKNGINSVVSIKKKNAFDHESLKNENNNNNNTNSDRNAVMNERDESLIDVDQMRHDLENELLTFDECDESSFDWDEKLVSAKDRNHRERLKRQLIDDDHTLLYGKDYFPELQGCALIRELHVYGQMIGVGSDSNRDTQHKGFGKRLLLKAETIAVRNGFDKIAIIAGIGTQGYYRKRGYQLRGSYMIKCISEESIEKDRLKLEESLGFSLSDDYLLSNSLSQKNKSNTNNSTQKNNNNNDTFALFQLASIVVAFISIILGVFYLNKVKR